jgi:short-subunit dehydrogenase
MAKTIFISGASRGFGRLWAEAFLKRGDNVAATARNLNTLSDLTQKYGKQLLAIQLDVNDRQADVDAVKQANDHFGRIDVLINNAGFGLFGSIEETTEQQAREQMETNFFGLVWLTQAVLPLMRQQGHGHIIQLSSMLGLVAVPLLGFYNASKFAVEGFSETLAGEVKDFGINVTLIEPNGFSTDWAGASAVHTDSLPAYEPLKAASQARMANHPFGNPEATVEAVLKLVDSNNPPLRLFLGKVGYPMVKQVYDQRFAEWDAWDAVAVAAHGN